MGMPCLNIAVTDILEHRAQFYSTIRAKKSKDGSPWHDDPDDEHSMIIPNVCKYLPLDTV
jgi:hypothetical protein